MYKKSLKKMLTKRFETRNFVSKGNGYIGPFGEEFNDFPQIQIKKKSKNSHSILNILILFLSYLLSNKVEQMKFFYLIKNQIHIKLIVLSNIFPFLMNLLKLMLHLFYSLIFSLYQ